MAIVLAMAASLPMTLAPRCELAEWRTTPAACWLSGWAAVNERVARNMAVMRGSRMTIIRFHY